MMEAGYYWVKSKANLGNQVAELLDEDNWTIDGWVYNDEQFKELYKIGERIQPPSKD